MVEKHILGVPLCGMEKNISQEKNCGPSLENLTVTPRPFYLTSTCERRVWKKQTDRNKDFTHFAHWTF